MKQTTKVDTVSIDTTEQFSHRHTKHERNTVAVTFAHGNDSTGTHKDH